MTCRGFIYHTMKSKLPATPCMNKAKDEFGFCRRHHKQSQAFQRQRELVPDSVIFYVRYINNTTAIKIRGSQRVISLYHQ